MVAVTEALIVSVCLPRIVPMNGMVSGKLL
jgi:hypothetical protein